MRDHPAVRSVAGWLFSLAVALARLPAETSVLLVVALGSWGGP